ncbi:MAG TPA: tRNA1(Val) (adenine(37)-N6)-methyltransferase [Candidatus Choladousia intestinavium]|uniref:tRNA1(Val) (Adenine(37)-N6)-methyltransferase n=1 Tax=Candidatus Choladousia intestinavium TaxID=2840727 RepID=A0A9D1AAX2_9FIRM|nr:tRNA1(Val) (adenine(37)-N6)-methyltransferase [Candidatus Choladousia intestinavium]
MKIELKEGERVDNLHRDGFRIIQNEKLFCFGMDAVLLTGFAKVREGENVLDLGTGTGIIPILLAAKTKGESFSGLEISEKSVDMAVRSVALNGIEDRVSIVQGDIKKAGELFAPASFDVVTSNPPYMTESHGLVNQDLDKAAARHEIFCTLEDVVSAAARLLKAGGRFYMVHRPFRLAEIIRALSEHRLEPKRMRLVYPYADREPNMVLIEAVRGGRPRMTVEKPLIVYQAPGEYTREVLEIYGY